MKPIKFALGLALALMLVGCTSTVAPSPIRAGTASYDHNEANSGVIGLAPGGGVLITANALARYNALVAIYGGRFTPPVQSGDGVQPTPTEGVFVMDAEHVAKFAQMNRWRKEAR